MSRLVGLNTRLFGPEHFSRLVVANFESALASLLRRILHDGQARFRFFPFYKEKDRSDEVALARLLKHLGDLTLPLDVCRFSSLRELTESVGGCDFFIGVRYHAVLLAAQTGVPVLGISYGRKTWRFMTESELGGFVLPLEEVTTGRLNEIWARLLAKPDDLREKLAAINSRQKRLALRHFDLIARTLSG